MPVKIKSIIENSLAVQHHLQPGDKILTINGHNIADFIDLQFFGADDFLDIELIRKDGRSENVIIEQDWTKPLGIEPDSHNCINCINDCIFCFVDQIQPGLRNTLYIKDDDYRLSFAYGNFITLTNLKEFHFKKILEQKLSPLYVSVHTTNPLLHRKMLKYTIDFDIYNILKMLTDNQIQLHTQIVVVPDWNDGKELERTLRDLNGLGENILSIGIVPVGLTIHRKSLIPLRSVTVSEAELIVDTAENFNRTYCADELFITAGRNIPDEEYYNYYPQLENGIGMLRLLLENWKDNKEEFIEFIGSYSEKLVFVTGRSAFPYLDQIAAEINLLLPDKVRTQLIENIIFGASVTVAGLLTATDIGDQVQITEQEIVCVCSNLFNDDLITLDNVHQQELKKRFNNKLIVIDEEFADWYAV